jgi:hypothetical protein
MKRLQKRLQQLEAQLRYGANKLSKSQLFGIVQKILVVEAAIAVMSQPQKTDLDIAHDLANDYDGKVWQGYGKTRVYFNITGFRKKFYIDIKNGNLDLTHAPVKVAFAIRYAA